MKLGEIKIESLKIMFANYNADIDIDKLSSLYDDENYGIYLVNMNGAINRCFSVLEEKLVLPSKSVKLDVSVAEVSNGRLRFDLDKIVDNFFAVDRVIYENTSGAYNGNVDFNMEENTLVLPEIGNGESYRLLYKPTLARVSSDTEETTEIDIPNSIASHIPYFIKGDLYRDDEPNEASEARNWFELAMAELHTKQDTNINRVDTIFSQTEL